MTRGGRATVRSGVARVRRGVNRVDNAEVRQARGLLRAVRGRRPPTIIAFSESTALWVAPQDRDRRKLFAMVGDDLPASERLHTIAGGSFSSSMHLRFLRLLQHEDVRPILVVSLWTRGRTDPWIEHPTYGYKDTMTVLDRLPPRPSLTRVRASLRRPTAEDFDAFYRLPCETLIGERSIGEYVCELKDPVRFANEPDARSRLIYAYHQGSRLHAGSPQLGPVTELGRLLRKTGLPIIAYQTPISVATGVRLHGPDFETLTTSNFATLDAAFHEGYGTDIDIIQSGTIFDEDEFIDVSIADEHLNAKGRSHLARLIAARIRETTYRRVRS